MQGGTRLCRDVEARRNTGVWRAVIDSFEWSRRCGRGMSSNGDRERQGLVMPLIFAMGMTNGYLYIEMKTKILLKHRRENVYARPL